MNVLPSRDQWLRPRLFSLGCGLFSLYRVVSVSGCSLELWWEH